jgi:hypothetical protein
MPPSGDVACPKRNSFLLKAGRHKGQRQPMMMVFPEAFSQKLLFIFQNKGDGYET